MSVELPAPVGEKLAAGAFLLIDKPRGPSSHQVTAWVRDLLGLKSAGHAGTLDPNVSGVLWVGVGPALKLLPLVLQFPKRYVGVVALHGDASDAAVRAVLAEFRGPVYQTPPVRSAVKRERRVRTIHRLDLIERNGPRLLIDVVGDSGTYVRTLAVDVGDALGVGGNLEELRRTGTGPFREEDSVGVTVLSDAVAQASEGNSEPLLKLLHPMEQVWQEFPQIVLRDSAAAAIAHGADLASGGIERILKPFSAGQRVVLITRTGRLLALGRALVDSEEASRRRHGWVVDAERVLADASEFPASWRKPPAAPPIPDVPPSPG
ncbi:MAG: RNA-guided pseudouridylation complex pseudouridine synthase subunit Cbf5 [Thermoplasmata archaeon]|nr:RNA-guided pseudouridylation complex pseudouridine synthase subunit Cbf5 [Thermoplasmata archaeon]MCI4357083.1 RNA-guided pseudouridylation complex pseudouridine synthase subunit Cbf5 [Thermoplasmata archaeon]